MSWQIIDWDRFLSLAFPGGAELALVGLRPFLWKIVSPPGM